MDLILKQFIIIASTFFIILWFQNVDDNKHNKIRETFYEKYKLPIFVSAIIGFIINIPEFLSSISCEPCDTNIAEFAIFTSVDPSQHLVNNLKKISPIDITRQNVKNVIGEQQIFTDLPNF